MPKTKNTELIIQMDGIDFDANALSNIMFKKFQLNQKCPICILTTKDFSKIHNDAIPYGHNDPEFIDKWIDRFPQNIIKSHFSHHCVFSDMVDVIRTSNRQQISVVEEDEPNSKMIQTVISGEFHKMYAESINDQLFVQGYKRSRFVQEYEKQSESGKPSSLAMKMANELESSASQTVAMLTKLDQLHHNKASKSLQNAIVSLRTRLMEEILMLIQRIFVKMQGDLALRFGGSDESANILEPYLMEIRDGMVQIYQAAKDEIDNKFSNN